MAARVTQQEVFDAAEKIFASGINPTAAKIRKEIGRGSYSDICPSLQKWKITNKSSEQEDTAEPMPEELKLLGEQIGSSIAETIWVKAFNFAQDNVRLGMFAVLEDENKQLREENMHYKEMEVRLKIMEECYERIGSKDEIREKREKEKDEKIQKLEKAPADFLREKTQNK